MTVASTSAKVYKEEIKGAKEDSQAEIVYKAIVRIGRACTMREVQEYTKFEINVVSRSLNNLKKADKIDYFDADANTKGKVRRVHHYMIKEIGKQISLF